MSELDGSPLTGDPRSPDVLALVAAIRPVRPLGAHPSAGPAPGVPAALARLAARPGTDRRAGVDPGAPAPASAGRRRPAR
ncbi:hypothetical protein [Cellulomonas cellasea]|uniref:Uncharacterized protein n=2 Tax=Cellulomonas cellasea TaxID=43670 RepID=A0A0A0B7H3_9CELL|nr:hypothetical protein [Cellulomonas cellasea]KGM02168.1 hypothetical protein Q760_15160 [Cellulomonas cellasea DSM 20118]GEA88674.1 hypothetical protein CCE01nite_26230 [Cellulomonas cellasea]